MTRIVVYDKKLEGNPIVGIHAADASLGKPTLKSIHPSADPARYGIVVVADDVVERMKIRKYKQDAKGIRATKPVTQEKTKTLSAIVDSALGQSIAFFAEAYVDIVNVLDLADKRVPSMVVDASKGLVGVGTRVGLFTVTCTVATGAEEPEVIAEEKNWDWVRDSSGAVTGLKLLK